MKNRICVSIDNNLLLTLKKLAGELQAKTGIIHSISELIEIAVKEKYSEKIRLES